MILGQDPKVEQFKVIRYTMYKYIWNEKMKASVKKSCQNVYPRTHIDPLFTELNFLKYDKINKSLVGRIMYGINNEDHPM